MLIGEDFADEAGRLMDWLSNQGQKDPGFAGGKCWTGPASEGRRRRGRGTEGGKKTWLMNCQRASQSVPVERRARDCDGWPVAGGLLCANRAARGVDEVCVRAWAKMEHVKAWRRARACVTVSTAQQLEQQVI